MFGLMASALIFCFVDVPSQEVNNNPEKKKSHKGHRLTFLDKTLMRTIACNLAMLGHLIFPYSPV